MEPVTEIEPNELLRAHFFFVNRNIIGGHVYLLGYKAFL